MWKKIVLIALSTTLYLFSDVIENSKEINIEKAQKTTFITFDKVGSGIDLLEIPFMDCRYNCEEIEKWKIPISSVFITNTKENNEYYLLEKEFDIINMSYNNFQFEIKDKLYFEKYKGAQFSDEVISFDKYQIELEKHINHKDFQQPFKNIVLKSIEKRKTLKPSYPISNTLKMKLLKKNYLIAFYIENLEGEFRAIKSRKDDGFNLVTDVDLVLKAMVYRYEPKSEKLVFLRSFDGESLSIDATRNIKELYSINYFDSKYKHLPNRSDGMEEFKIAFQNSFEEVYQNIIDQIDKLDLFRSFSPVLAVNNDFVKFNQISRKEFLRIDAPIYLQNIDKNGTVQNVAWGKIKDIGNSDKNGSRESQAKIIKSENSIADFSYTFIPYWSGMFWGVKSEFGSSKLLSKNSSVASISEIRVLGDLAFDLGYIFNLKYLSEIWLNLSVYTGQENFSIENLDHVTNLELNYLFGLQTGLEYKYHLKQQIFLSLGLDIGAKFSKYEIGYFNSLSDDYRPSYGDGTLNIASYYLELKGGGGYSITPDLEAYSNIAYTYQVLGNSYIEENGKVVNKNAMDYIDSRDFKYGTGVRIALGIRFSY